MFVDPAEKDNRKIGEMAHQKLMIKHWSHLQPFTMHSSPEMGEGVIQKQRSQTT